MDRRRRGAARPPQGLIAAESVRDGVGGTTFRARHRPWILIADEVANGCGHSRKQIQQIADSIAAFGFVNPILVDEDNVIIAGHGRYAAAKVLGLKQVPVIEVRGLSKAKRRALALADNRIAEGARWNRELLAVELPELAELLIQDDLDISLTGFGPIEIDPLHVDVGLADLAHPNGDIDHSWQSGPAVSQRGTLWLLDQHRILCGDARSEGDLDRLMGASRAAMAFLDVPPDTPAPQSGAGAGTERAKFGLAGEMSGADRVALLAGALGNAGRVSHEGAIHFVGCDWRQMREIMDAGARAYGEVVDVVAWVKPQATPGPFYRSQHELIAVFRVGKCANLSRPGFGRRGRPRSNVWTHRGGPRSYPTMKPVGLIADAIRECTRRGDIILDTFAGSGTTILAAEQVGRRAYALEIEPRLVDGAVRRWQASCGKNAVEAASGQSFDQLAQQANPPEDHVRGPGEKGEVNDAAIAADGANPTTIAASRPARRGDRFRVH